MQKNVKFNKNLRGKFGLNFAKISVCAIFIFAISFGFWLNFAPKNQNSANAIDENLAQNSENQIYEIKKLDFINFDGESYIDTKIDQLGDTKVAADFKLDKLQNSWIFGARTVVNGSMFEFFAETTASQNWRVDLGNAWRGVDNNGAEAGMPPKPDVNRHQIFLNNSDDNVEIDGEIVTLTYRTGFYPQRPTNFVPPTIAQNIFVGGMNNGGSFAGTFVGKIYSFQIYKDEKMVLNLIPATRFLCDGEVEYGFANDLDGDGNLANDEFFGNSGSGKLTGSEEVLAEKCPEKPENPNENPENPPTEITPPIQNPDKILPPNTGIFARKNLKKIANFAQN